MTIVRLDGFVRQKLRAWPNQPPGLEHERHNGAWAKARPGIDETVDHPYLKLPGTQRLRTVPDGLWMSFGGSERDPFVDIFGIM